MYVYARYCPVAATATLIGDFWTPLIVRELLYGTGGFNQLARNVPGISRTVLSARLQALKRANLIEQTPGSNGRGAAYALTPAGRAMEPIIDAMSDWGRQWGAPQGQEDEVDPLVAVCMLKSRLHCDALPDRRVVIQVDVEGPPDGRAWIVIDRGQVSMCFDPPGFDIDLFVRSDPATLYQIWLQHLVVRDAEASAAVRVDGPANLVRQFAGWFEPSRV